MSVTAYCIRWVPRSFHVSSSFLYRAHAEKCLAESQRHLKRAAVIEETEVVDVGYQSIRLARRSFVMRNVRSVRLLPSSLVSLPGQAPADYYHGFAYVLGTWYEVSKIASEAHCDDPWEIVRVVATLEHPLPPRGASLNYLLNGMPDPGRGRVGL